MALTYLFGQPVRPTRSSAVGPRDVFVLGAYPSALHVRWFVPGRARPVQAVAVDDEPEPFWTGHDQDVQIERWCRQVEFHASWGRVAPCGHLNGSSGVWVDERVLRPLGADRSQTWITDCLDTYFESKSAAACLSDHVIVATSKKLGITLPRHRPHPSENEIVREALNVHRDPLLEEIRAARPKVVVTLGNAALRVLTALTGGDRRLRLSPRAELYGRRSQVSIGDHDFEWIPLAHPGAPRVYQRAHDAWMVSLRRLA